MARMSSDKQYQPCLLDRLLDDRSQLDDARTTLASLVAQQEVNECTGGTHALESQRQLLAAKTKVRLLEDKVQRAAYGEQHLRDAVLQELSWLLSTSSFESTMAWKQQRGSGPAGAPERFVNAPVDLAHYPDIMTSVVNYGLRDITGQVGIRATPKQIGRVIEEAIERFEPRIMPESLDVIVRVDRDRDGDDEPNCVSIEIRATVWGNPLPQALYLKSLLDVETGDFRIVRAGDG